MARKLRVEFPGAIYHIMNRGDRRERVFWDDTDRIQFLDTLGEACVKTDWEIHAYALIPNHFHMVVETPKANLVKGMKWLLGTYTGRFNRRHRLTGHLFAGRYKSLLVQYSKGDYFRSVCEYVLLNPARANLLTEDQKLREYPWSSFPMMLNHPGQRPSWLRVDRLFGELGIPRDSVAGRQRFEQILERRRLEDNAREFEKIRRAWFVGDDEFRQELLAHASGRLGKNHYGPERMETESMKAERIIAEELKARGWTESDLAERRKGDPEKVVLAVRLRTESTMTIAWIAQRLRMGSASTLNRLLFQHRRHTTPTKQC